MLNFIRRQILESKNVFRANILAGMLFLLPILATVFLINLLITWVDMSLLLLPPQYRPENYLPVRIPGLGLLLVIIILFVTGMFVRNFLGRKLVEIGERLMRYIPFVSKVYSWIKQMVDTLLLTSGKEFKRVVMVEYPRRGIWAMAFVTGVAEGEVQDKTNHRVINVFLPTTPNPTSGFYLLVPETDVIPLDMSVEDSMKLIMSGGILVPDNYKKQSNNGAGCQPAAPAAPREEQA
ncbi:DUF502 domain-containing protein [Megalodesulfovibrio gigas]|uniref:Transporter n=1 Tax=Megalodesulfovibrio gigas (strain ATCC 19364 / DSM 1382 / NCIMB 9332 / VKM B-1759) TaxID=1121448 RepID=T2GAD4_MEGG1|nr:DUF502 domain-containing protein [Megalodesulfovibrio gigas]AGW13066.1 putative protein of unknown function [Megalodesulfovibrio gigas DSM 1382 = ATCC 19364]